MKLRTKLSLANLLVNLFFLLFAGFSVFYVVDKAVFNELDEHLVNHKQDLVQRFEKGEITLQTIREMGSIGSYEWIEFDQVSDSNAEPSVSFKTVEKARFKDQPVEKYRQLTSVIILDATPYRLTIYEEIGGWKSIAITIIITILVILFAWYIIVYFGYNLVLSQTLRPFFDTIEKLRGIRSDRDFEISFPEVSTTEFNELNSTLNTMLSELEDSFKKQKHFIQNASHELLTPLSIIRQKTDELLNKPLDEHTLVSLSNIQRTVIRLKKLSNALLLISRVENKHYSINENVSLSELIEKVHSELSDFLLNKNVSLKYDPNELKTIQGNTDLIHSVFYNVLQNAVYHTESDTEIAVQAALRGPTYHITVQDSGPGIPEEDLDQIFERFRRSSGNNGSGNHGLGLAIVKSICDLHSWDCYFEKGLNTGSCFHLEIPKVSLV
tara:strand:+ start:118876 stop:120192 length:1317 start_codon:yes stop_codon:yes gene_type:complete